MKKRSSLLDRITAQQGSELEFQYAALALAAMVYFQASRPNFRQPRTVAGLIEIEINRGRELIALQTFLTRKWTEVEKVIH